MNLPEELVISGILYRRVHPVKPAREQEFRDVCLESGLTVAECTGENKQPHIVSRRRAAIRALYARGWAKADIARTVKKDRNTVEIALRVIA